MVEGRNNMALVKFGSTKCRLCGETLQKGESVVAFPAFVPPNHAFFSFADCAYHQECFKAWVHVVCFQNLYESYRSIWDSRPANLSFKEAEEWGKHAFDKVFSEPVSE